MKGGLWLLLCGALFAGCSVQRRANDPSPMLPVVTATEPPLSADTIAAVPSEQLPPSVSSAPSNAASRTPAAARRAWGRVAISTSVLSPSQLMGPELAYSPEFQRLPAFPEKIVFDVSWGILSVGEATLEVDKIVQFNGRPAYHLVSQARSNSFCDTFYPVRDLNESWFDAKTLTSLGYAKKLREGSFYRDVWVLYDRDSHTFVERQTSKDGSFRVRVGTIPAQVQDILSSVYYTRAQTLTVGGEVIVDVNTPDNWPLVIKVLKREAVRTVHGLVPGILVEPAMRKEGIFIQKGKRLQLWLSDDASRRPLQMKVEVFFGHVTALLREMV